MKQYHKLIQHVKTRWNSVFICLQQYIEQQEAISKALCLLDRNDLVISTDKNSFIRDTTSALQLFETVTREISSEKYVSISDHTPF